MIEPTALVSRSFFFDLHKDQEASQLQDPNIQPTIASFSLPADPALPNFNDSKHKVALYKLFELKVQLQHSIDSLKKRCQALENELCVVSNETRIVAGQMGAVEATIQKLLEDK